MCCVRIVTRTVFIAAMLQAQTSCCSGCKENEVTWRSNNKAQDDTCLACIDCPDGMEPSIPCGTVAKYGTHLHCVECKEGTFSDTYGEGQCKPCSVCSVGRTVAQNCSATKNTRCGSCSYGYYESKVVFDCLPCSFCCWDGRDQFESQCKAQGLPRHRRCKPRHQRGCQAPWTSGVKATSAAITDVRQNERAMKQNSSSTTRKTTTIASEEKSAPLSSTTQEHFISTEAGDQNTSSLIRSIDSATDSYGKSNLTFKKSKRSWSDNSVANKNRVIKGVSLSIAILMMIAVVVKRKTLVAHFKWARCHFTCGCRSSDAEQGGATESSMLDDIKAPVSAVPKGVLITMKELKSLSLDTYDRLWKRLDRNPGGAKKGDFKRVAVEFKYTQEDIWELEKELKTSGSGSPSRQLLDGLETRRPELTVLEFVKVLQKPNIRRDDIVKLLNDYIYR